MTATAALVPATPVTAPAEGGPRRRRARSWLVVVLMVVLALAVAVWSSKDAEKHPDPLDPRNPGPEGAQAVAKVLDDEGVDVTIARSAAALEETEVDRDTTVVVTSTSALSPSTLDRLRRHAAPGRLVLVDPTWQVLREVGASRGSTSVGEAELRADCETVAGIDVAGLTLRVDHVTLYRAEPGERCFPADGRHALVEDPEEDLVLLGAGQALGNDQVLRADNAALALRLLGEDPRLVWYVPDPADATADDAVSLGSLLPDWIVPALWMLALACVALVLWRFRRLGPLSTEPLPVVVRAVETARSRGRMYRRSGDRAHAAQALRRAATTALAQRLRLDRHADPLVVADAVARQSGRQPQEVAHLLTGPPPASDQELVRLAQELARLRKEVRRG